MAKESGSPRYIDIFSGCGGLSLGLLNSGWKGLFAVEKDAMAFETLRYNLIEKKGHFDWPAWLPQSPHNIYSVLKKYKKELKSLEGTVDLVAGGPPCQGFSFAGRRDRNDRRNRLVNAYIKFVSIVQPKAILFENVRGFTVPFRGGKRKTKTYSDYVMKRLENLGYKVLGKLVDFSKFGVPQKRQRFIIIGLKGGDPEKFFDRLMGQRQTFLMDKGLPISASVYDALSDLEGSNGYIIDNVDGRFKLGVYAQPRSTYQNVMRDGTTNRVPDSHRFARHNIETTERFRYILEKCKKNVRVAKDIRTKLYLKKHSIAPLGRDGQSPTLTTLPDDIIHYSEPRILTVREYARLQSFPDWFEFKGKYTTGGKRRKNETPRYTQVGNAVPPLFAEQVGNLLMGDALGTRKNA